MYENYIMRCSRNLSASASRRRDG